MLEETWNSQYLPLSHPPTPPTLETTLMLNHPGPDSLGSVKGSQKYLELKPSGLCFHSSSEKGLLLVGWKSSPSWAGRSVSGSLALCWIQGAWLCWQLNRPFLPYLPTWLSAMASSQTSPLPRPSFLILCFSPQPGMQACVPSPIPLEMERELRIPSWKARGTCRNSLVLLEPRLPQQMWSMRPFRFCFVSPLASLVAEQGTELAFRGYR